MADNKAYMMLTIGVGVIGVSATQIFDPQLQYAALTPIVSSLVTVGLAVLATMPTLPTNKTVDPRDPNFNITFFSDFARMPYDEYLPEMERMLADRTLTNRALLWDLYSHGTVLNGKKFRLLGYCYPVFAPSPPRHSCAKATSPATSRSSASIPARSPTRRSGCSKPMPPRPPLPLPSTAPASFPSCANATSAAARSWMALARSSGASSLSR